MNAHAALIAAAEAREAFIKHRDSGRATQYSLGICKHTWARHLTRARKALGCEHADLQRLLVQTRGCDLALSTIRRALRGAGRESTLHHIHAILLGLYKGTLKLEEKTA